ncbi:MAG: TonB-dependent receptor [Sphingobium sp.]|nr:TonB-dependent receptor [Sphingobium sp.]
MVSKASVTAILLSSAVLMPCAAFAQAAPAIQETSPQDTQRNSAIGDIVVTAQRREQRLQDVPVSVNVTTGETLAKTGTTDLVGLSIRSPGFNLGVGPQSNLINIRGVGSGLNAGFEQSVGTFVDGVYRPRSRMITAGLFDVERVEILNGPQTTFFGNNTVAGAINITSKKPSNIFGYEAQALYSPSDGEYVAMGAVTGPISDTLSARVAARASGMDGYIYNSVFDNHGPHMRDFVTRGSLRWEPTDKFQSNLRVEYARNRDTGTFNVEATGCPADAPFPAPSARPNGPCAVYLGTLPGGGGNPDNSYNFVSQEPGSDFRLDAVEAAWTNAFTFDWGTLTSITSYSHQRSRSFLNATPLPSTGVAGFYYSPFTQAETYGMFAQELRLEGEATDWLDYMVGAYYSHGDLTSRSVSSLYNLPGAAGAAGAPVTNASTPIESNRNLFQKDQTRSVFGQMTVRPATGLRLNLGVRYTSVKKDASRTFRAGIGNANAVFEDLIFVDPATEAKLVTAAGGNTANFSDPHTTYNKLMPSASLQYDIIPTITAYGSYTEGFKAGGYSDSNTPNQFDSEFVDSYEIGLKGSLFDRRLFFTLDAFYLDYKGLQQALTIIGPTGASITTVGNAAASRSKGIEFTGSLKASDFLTFNVAGAYIDSKFKSYVNAGCTVAGAILGAPYCVANAQDVSGRPTPFAPKFSGSVSATVTIPTSADYAIKVDPNVFHSTGYYMTPTIDPLLQQGHYTTFDLRVGFGPTNGKWEFAVIGKNLSDEYIKSTGSSVGTSPGLVYALPQRARSVAFQFTIRH